MAAGDGRLGLGTLGRDVLDLRMRCVDWDGTGRDGVVDCVAGAGVGSLVSLGAYSGNILLPSGPDLPKKSPSSFTSPYLSSSSLLAAAQSSVSEGNRLTGERRDAP